MLKLLSFVLAYLLTISSVQATHTYTIDPPPCTINPNPSTTNIFAGVSTNISVTGAVSLFSISLDSSPTLPGLPKSKNTQPLFPFTYTWADPQLAIPYTFTADVVDSISGNAGSCAQVYTPVATPPSLPDAPINLDTDSCPMPGTRVRLSWAASSGADYYNYTVGANTIANLLQPAGVDPMIVYYSPTTPGINYDWSVQACNASGCSAPTNGTPFTCSDAITPWIQVWGDVHSNTRIYAPGGP